MGIMQLKSSGAAKQAPAKKVKKISFKENKQEQSAADLLELKKKADAELFNNLMTKAIELGKFKTGDTRLEAFSLKCEEYAKANDNAIPGSDFVVAALKEVGADEIAEAFEKALAGIDLDIAVSEIPDIEEAPEDEDSSTDTDSSEVPADEEPTGDAESTDADKPEDNPPLNEEQTEQPVDGTTQTPADEEPADQEAAPRRAGRPRKNV